MTVPTTTLRPVAGAAWLCSVFLVASLAAPAALAQDASPIAFVDMRKALFSSREGRAAQDQYSKLADSKREQLRPMQEELSRLEEEFERQKYVLSAEALGGKQLDRMKRRRDLERAERAAADDLQIEQVRLLQPIQKKISEAIKQVGKERGFSMVIDINANGMLYHRESLDITDLVVKRLNES